MIQNEENFEGFIPSIVNQKGHTVEYNPEKFWKENTIDSVFADLFKMDEETRRRGRIKPEYILTPHEAKTLQLEHIAWICENYRVLCGLEAHNIVKKREQDGK